MYNKAYPLKNAVFRLCALLLILLTLPAKAINFTELKQFANNWLSTDCENSFDYSNDCNVNFIDFGIFADHWLCETGDIITPIPGSTFTSDTVTFNYSPGDTDIEMYRIDIGSNPDTNDVNSSLIAAGTISYTFYDLPVDGRDLYVKLSSMLLGKWYSNDYSYTAYTQCMPAEMISPTPGTRFSGPTVTFQWDCGVCVDAYQLDIGTYPNGTDIFSQYMGASQSQEVTDIPTDGSTIYVTLKSWIDRVWHPNNYIYYAQIGPGQPAEITSPTDRTNLTSSTVTFSWNAGTFVTAYKLKVGTNPAGTDIYDGPETTNQSQLVTNLPTDGSTVYVRLWSKINESWTDNYNDYTYTSLKNPPAGTHSFLTGGNRIMVIHDTSDEYLYFDTPSNEVAYTMQIIKESNNKYYIAYHGEPNKPNAIANRWWGDGLKVAIRNGSFNYTIPSTRNHALWSAITDGPSRIWSSDIYSDYIDSKHWRTFGGPGNPMVVKGPTDSYYYVHFIACTDTDGNHHLTTYDEGDFSHFLGLARTTNFTSYEMRTELPAPDGICWKPYGINYTWDRPRCLDDTTGAQLTCRRTDYYATTTNGMLGSICYYNGNYYYFYCDDKAGSSSWYLYYRWTDDVDEPAAATSWSSAILISTDAMGYGQKVVVAPAHDMDRWVVVYHALQDNGSPNNIPDICVQYTENMNIVGSGGISDIIYNDNGNRDSHYLGRQIGALTTGGTCYQQYFMTDPTGRLAVPDDKPQNATSGGLVTFTDHKTNGVWGGEVYCMGWDLYVPQATVPNPSDGATSVSTSAILSWDAGYKATYYKVYFGTSSPPPYIGEQVETTYDPTLQSSQTYYWRIDAVNGDDSHITQGKVWSFTTQ